MLNILKTLDKNLERWLTLTFYVMVVMLICMEVLQRFLISYSSIWGEEIARYCFIYLAWVGAAFGVKDRAHLRIDLLIKGMPNRLQALIYLLGDLLGLGLSGLAFYLSIHPISVSMKFDSVTAGLRVPLWWFLLAIPIGFALIIIRLLQNTIRDAHSLATDSPLYTGKGIVDA